MFIDREDRLELLNSEYKAKGFKLTVIYGRQRIGKTALIKEYIKDKDAIYFLVTLESLPILIDRFKTMIADYFDDDFLRTIEISDIKDLFLYITKQKLNRKFIIIIDEFQYLSKLDSSIPSQFQYIVDEIVANSNIHLILCGSIISMMYSQTLSYNSPLYGRRSSAIKLEPLKPRYLKQFFPNKSENELIEIYAVLGGVPKYLKIFRDSDDIFRAIETNILTPSSYLYDEPKFLLQNEINEPVTYFSIIEAIAMGEHKLGNIASKIGKNVQNITSFINKLIELDIIYKEVPITQKDPHKSKKGLYFIKDNFFRFWFSFVLGNKSYLELENYEYVLHKIKTNFNGFVAKTYENLAIEFTLKKHKLLKCGRWWNGKNEIDIVGVGSDYLIVGECKYSNKKVGIDILEALKDKATMIDSDLPVKKYLLFSKSGFTEKLIESAKNSEEVELVDSIL